MCSMPKRTALRRILLIGSGPIVIGQAAEFDYSGTQAAKALKEEGYVVVLVNSNPATIMTDPELADRTYIEPVTPDWVRKVIERERPDALLPTMGGQTALNVAMALVKDGTLERFGVELIGANARAVQMAEDRAEFGAAMRRIGLATPVGRPVASAAGAIAAVGATGFPAASRPTCRLGGEAGGCNIQFAVNPADGELLVIEMNPRVSRSSALASKATGFPIARIGTKLAVGYTLDELPNDITKTTPASFEPVLDYVVVKVPRFAFEKFPTADFRLTTQMKSVGEAMAIGRTFKEAFQKGLRALEIGRPGWVIGASLADDRLTSDTPEDLRVALRTPTPERVFQIKRALLAGVSVDEVAQASGIDPWFLFQMEELLEAERWFAARPRGETGAAELRRMKRLGFSDWQLGTLRGTSEEAVRKTRWRLGVHPAYKTVDSCAGEFPSATPYLYRSYEAENG